MEFKSDDYKEGFLLGINFTKDLFENLKNELNNKNLCANNETINGILNVLENYMEESKR